MSVTFLTNIDREKLEKDISQLSEQISDLKQNGTGGTVASSVEPMEDDIPKVFFSEAIPQTKNDAVTGFRYISKTKDISGFAEFKAQGNSSMNYPKKNVTVKMYKDEALEEKLKIDFKNWGEQRKHVYKANWIDLTHARNIVSARLWADVVKSRADYELLPKLLRTSPNQGAVDGFPVKVYSQGIYQGRYTLNIPKDAWMSNMDDSLDNHCILCGENYVSGCFRALAQINESDWTDEIHEVVPSSIKTRWNEVISFVMNSTDEEFKANLGNYFFVDSLIDYFIFGMVSCGLDAFGKNQIYMTYDGIKWIASMYDMDSTWGLYWNGSKFVSTSYSRTEFEDFVSGRQGNLLYIRLTNLFYEEIQSRYEELKQGVLSIPNIINHFERFIDITPLDLVKEDYASTTGGSKFTGIPSQSTNNIQQIRKFVVDRYVYCDEYFANLLETEPDIPDEPDIPVEPEQPEDENLLYSLPEATTFDGTNYVDTGVQLFVEDKPFTVILDWEHGDSNFALSTHVVAHCMRESNPYPGLTVQYGSETMLLDLQMIQTNKVAVTAGMDGITVANFERGKIALRKNTDGTMSIFRRWNRTGEVYVNSTKGTFVAIDSTLLLGCYQTLDGTKGRFAKGIMHMCDVYGMALSDEEITEILERGQPTLPDVPEALVYSLPEATTFDGTNYVDTGYKLFDEDKDFTLMFDYQLPEVKQQPAQSVVVQCALEQSPYPGIIYRFGNTNSGNYGFTAYGNVDKVDTTIETLGTNANKVVITHVKGSNKFKLQSSYSTMELALGTSFTEITPFDETVVLGAGTILNGLYRRYWQGTINQLFIYERVLSDDEITEFIEPQVPEEHLVYSLRETSFNADNVIDTGVSTDDLDEYTVYISFTYVGGENDNSTVISAMKESGTDGYPGWALDRSNGGFVRIAANTPITMFTGGVAFKKQSIVIRKRSDGSIYAFGYCHGTTATNAMCINGVDITSNITDTAIDQNILVGGHWMNNAYARKFIGTIHKCKIYDIAHSDEECKAFLGV